MSGNFFVVVFSSDGCSVCWHFRKMVFKIISCLVCQDIVQLIDSPSILKRERERERESERERAREREREKERERERERVILPYFIYSY